jgi:hypothetical protein
MAGLVPVLFVSQRRRLLALIEEESRVLGVVTDEATKVHLAKALRATSHAYMRIATLRPHQRARRRMIFIGGPAYFVSVAAGVFNVQRDKLADTEKGQDILFWGSLGVMVLTGLVALYFMFAAFMAIFDKGQESRELRLAREREKRLRESRKKLEASLNDVDEKLSAYETRHRPGSASGQLPAADPREVSALVEALQTSVDSAKATRSQEDAEEAERRARRRANRERRLRHELKVEADANKRAAIATNEDDRAEALRDAKRARNMIITIRRLMEQERRGGDS